MTARALVLGVLAAAGFAACGSPPQGAVKAGAPPTTILRLASPTPDLVAWPAVRAFVRAVERRSGGRLRVVLVPTYGNYAPDTEQRTVRGVARGDVDAGFVKSGVFDQFGVTSVRALTAPMLITSYAAQAAVMRSELPDMMLRGVRGAGVTGLALLADGLIRPFGAAAPLVAPGDYRGQVLGTYPSRAAASALGGLGARTSGLWAGPLTDAVEAGRVDGFVRPLWFYASSPGNASAAPYGVSNLVLWPNVLALIADPRYLDRLPRERRRWVKRAAADAAVASIELARRDLHLVATACDDGGRFSVATPAQLDALRAAFAPAVAELERDAGTRASMARIRALVAGAPDDAKLAIPPGCTGAPIARLRVRESRAGPYDGVYRWTLTAADQTHDPFYDPTLPKPTADVFTLWLDHQRWRLRVVHSGGAADEIHTGTFRVDGDRATFAWGPDGTATDVFRFRRTRDGLRVTGVSGDPGDLFVWAFRPWRKVE